MTNRELLIINKKLRDENILVKRFLSALSWEKKCRERGEEIPSFVLKRLTEYEQWKTNNVWQAIFGKNHTFSK
jgi:hypothetical protein